MTDITEPASAKPWNPISFETLPALAQAVNNSGGQATVKG